MKNVKTIFPTSLESFFKEGGLRNWLHNNSTGSFISEEEFSPFWLGQKLASSKILILKSLLLIIFLIIVGRLAYLQIFNGNHYLAVAEGNRIKEEYILPQRGIIFDRYNTPLVSNAGSFGLVLGQLPRNFSQADLVNDYNLLKPYLTKYQVTAADPAAWQTVVKKAAAEPQVLIDDLAYEDALRLKLLLPETDVVSVQAEAQRQYGGNGAWSHVLGYLGQMKPEEKATYLKNNYQLTEKVGRDGLEAVYEQYLHGQVGVHQLEVNSLGKIIDELALEPEQPGANLQTNLDADLSQFIADTLKAKIPKYKGAVIVEDPRNGQILSLVSWPTYDDNVFNHALSQTEAAQLFQNPDQPMFDRAVSGNYPSGSTVKIVYASGGLDSGVINKDFTVLSTGGIHLGSYFFPDWKAGGHGVTNVIKALAESVNTFFYILADENYNGHVGLGLAGMQKYLGLFGIGVESGIDLLNEGTGFIPSVDWKTKTQNLPWYPGDTLHLGIGQGDLLVTPLQVADYTSAVANGGTLYRPYIVSTIKNSDGQTIKQIDPQVIRSNFINPDALAVVRDGLRTTITAGSARFLGDLAYPVAGKTGTAQVANGASHAWFTGYMPYDNPQIVVTVLVENGGEGSTIAVPIAKEIFKWYGDHRLATKE